MKINQTEYISEGTLNAFYTYCTKDGSHYYQFNYVYVSGYYEIDIISQPYYRTRDAGLAKTHRLPSPRKGINHKVCISDDVKRTITLTKAKKISMEWAELTSKYIRTGITIDNQIAAYSN